MSIVDKSGEGIGSRWPLGQHSVPHAQLSEMLLQSARFHARRSLTQYSSGDDDALLDAAASTGSALELMAKALLAITEAGLLADRGDPDSVLRFADKGHLAHSPASQTKTKSASEVLILVKRLHPAFQWNPPVDELALKVRNAAVHLGIVDATELRSAVKIMSRAVDDMVRFYGEADRSAFWGEAVLRLVDQLLDEAASEVKRGVAAKVAAAGAELARRTLGLPPETAELLLRALSGSAPRTSAEHAEAAECPVCHRQGWLLCGVDRGPVEWDVDDEGMPHGAWVDLTAWPEAFECPVCGLDLDSGELVEFDFPTEISLESDDDPHEVQWEPDEDTFRDR